MRGRSSTARLERLGVIPDRENTDSVDSGHTAREPIRHRRSPCLPHKVGAVSAQAGNSIVDSSARNVGRSAIGPRGLLLRSSLCQKRRPAGRTQADLMTALYRPGSILRAPASKAFPSSRRVLLCGVLGDPSRPRSRTRRWPVERLRRGRRHALNSVGQAIEAPRPSPLWPGGRFFLSRRGAGSDRSPGLDLRHWARRRSPFGPPETGASLFPTRGAIAQLWLRG